MPRPQISDFPEFYGKYIARVDVDNLADAISTYGPLVEAFYTGLPEEKAEYRYAAGKWTLKEVLQHVIDTERIMSYRLLRISRKDKTPLPSFDENSFSDNSQAGNRSFASLKEEFLALRKSTDLLVQSLHDDQLTEQGTASNLPVTAKAVGYIIYGHMLHHKAVVEERYF